MPRKIDGTHAFVALSVLHGADDDIQRAPLSDELAATWRAAAHKDPDSAIDWWKSSTVMGSRLRKLIRTKEVANLFSALPPDVAVKRILYSEDRLEEVAAKLLPRSSVVAMWHRGFDGAYEALHAWGGEDPLGAALRRHVGPALLTVAWNTVGSGSWADALTLWKDRFWNGSGLRHYVNAETFRRFWPVAAQDDPRCAARLLDSASDETSNHLKPLDLAPLATSNDDYAREVALRHLEKMIGRGLSEPEDPKAFIEEWRAIMSTNGQWAAELILAAPASVRARLGKADIAILLESADDETRLKTIATLPEQLRLAGPD